MESKIPNTMTTRLARALPWLVRYPFWRAGELVRRMTERIGTQHLILGVANHFEPSYDSRGDHIKLDWDTQMRRVEDWCEQARAIGTAVRDHDGTPFRHTNFFPGEQYYGPLLDQLAALQAEGFGEVEIHLHHGVERPDTSENVRRALVTFRDLLAEEHGCLSREGEGGAPKYAFVHGNWALANSAGGRCCGVDDEMQILAETGCYADLTLPSAPDISQVPRLNAIYQCGRPLGERAPHRSGPGLKVGDRPKLPIILTGPLVLDWGRRRKFGLPVPKLDNGALIENYPLDTARLLNWQSAHISVRGRPGWVFLKLYCHGFFPNDQPYVIGSEMRRFLEEVLELSERTGRFKLHFATAREMFNMVMAAVDGREGEPGAHRDYRLRQLMRSPVGPRAGARQPSLVVS